MFVGDGNGEGVGVGESGGIGLGGPWNSNVTPFSVNDLPSSDTSTVTLYGSVLFVGGGGIKQEIVV